MILLKDISKVIPAWYFHWPSRHFHSPSHRIHLSSGCLPQKFITLPMIFTLHPLTFTLSPFTFNHYFLLYTISIVCHFISNYIQIIYFELHTKYLRPSLNNPLTFAPYPFDFSVLPMICILSLLTCSLSPVKVTEFSFICTLLLTASSLLLLMHTLLPPVWDQLHLIFCPLVSDYYQLLVIFYTLPSEFNQLLLIFCILLSEFIRL